jgi:proteasome lid subunit RPN8/RPN11
MQPVRINREVLEGILRHAREDAPLECCGLLMGASDTITHQRKMMNMLRSQNRYSMDPQALFSSSEISALFR